MKSWFAASLKMMVLVENAGLWRRCTSIVFVRAHDFDEAFDAACQIGFEQEEAYLNQDGERVRWAFERVETLDMLPEPLTNGLEVYSEPSEVLNDASVAFDVVLRPRETPPGQSGVSPT